MSQPEVIVIGAGMGGMCTAARLARQGHVVRVLEGEAARDEDLLRAVVEEVDAHHARLELGHDRRRAALQAHGAVAAVYSFARAVIRDTAASPSCSSQPREPFMPA